MPKETTTNKSDIDLLNRGREVIKAIEAEVAKVVYGPEIQAMIDAIIVAGIFGDGHVVVCGNIGLGKTLGCGALAKTIDGVFNKVNFTPDMLPSVLTGFPFFNQETGKFEIEHGPLLGTNIFLADEINRGTPKTQSALLSAMEERQLVIRRQTFKLEPVFIVLATRNPMEHEGTYPLPEAQLDRFLVQHNVLPISEETELKVLADPDFWRAPSDRLQRVQPVTNPAEIVDIRNAIFKTITVEPRFDMYLSRFRQETWKDPLVQFGSSIRGSINLKKVAMVLAFRAGRDYATYDDIKRFVLDVIPHRTFLKPSAKPEHDTSAVEVIEQLLQKVKEVP